MTVGRATPPRAETLDLECHGVVVRIGAPDAELLDEVRRLLPPDARRRRGGRPHVRYRVRFRGRDAAGRALLGVTMRDAVGDDREIACTPDARAAAALLAHDVQFRVALYAPARLFVHAAAVAWKGRVIVVPGRSRSGKSTLAAALVRAGALYLSDEYAVLDAAGYVHPFARPLHLRDRDGCPAGMVRAEELGGACAATPLPLGLVVCARYRGDDAEWRPRPMSPGRTALALLAHAVAVRLRPSLALEYVARALAGGAQGIRAPRGAADDVAHRLLDDAAHTPAWRGVA